MPTKTNTKNISSEVELLNIVINPSVDKERSSCWEECFSSQFPTGSMIEKNGKYIVQVGAPHEGYTIETHLLNNKIHGKSNLYSNEDLLMAELTFEEGVAEGPCTLYDTASYVFFKGYFKNGYRSGKGKEYDREGNVIFDGYFSLGKRLFINRLNEMSGYWKEYDEKGKLLNISTRNAESGEKEGICYYYNENGNMSHIVEVKEGIENEYNGYCKLYDEPHKTWFEGFVENGIRHGKGKEYDSLKNEVTEVFFDDGKKLKIEIDNKMKGYRKEYDEQDHLVNICKRDENGRFYGICYRYDANGKISRISEWKDGKETTLIKTFNGNYMVEYKNGVKYYEGEYSPISESVFIRSGQGKEFDANGRSVIYQGSWFNGKRHGKGASYQNRQMDYDGEWINGRKKKEYYSMIWGRIAACIGVIVILIVVSFFIKVWLGIALSVLLLVLLLLCVRWYFCQIRCGLDYQMAKVLHRPNLKFGNSYNFHGSSFVIRGIEMILNIE